MSEPAISVSGLSKCYRLGSIGHHTLVDELEHVWHRLRGRDPRTRMGKISEGVPLNQGGDDLFWALKDVSFDVQPGELLGIIGRNGAGKSTLLKLLTRITEPTSGEAVINGRVASLLEVGTGFHPELTGRENIYMNGTILGMKKREIDAKFDEIVAFSEIEKFIDTPVKRYSSGMYVRLAFAVAAHLESEILLVDEVLAVGDAAFQQKCIGKMGDVAKNGRTILFVSHQMAAVENLCTRCILIHKGHVEKVDSPPAVINHYLNGILDAATRIPLDHRVDRSGTGVVKLTSWHIEDGRGRPVKAVQSGGNLTVVLGYTCRGGRLPLRDVDVGIALHDSTGLHLLSVAYGSYQGFVLTLDKLEGEIRISIDSLPLAAGRYRIGVRVTAGGEEADWPRDGIGYITVMEGDFYGTGRGVSGQSAPLLLKGQWAVRGNNA